MVQKAGPVAAKAEAARLLASLTGIGQAQLAIHPVAAEEMLRQGAVKARNSSL